MSRYGCSLATSSGGQLAGALLHDRPPARVSLPRDDVLDGRRLAHCLVDRRAHRQPRAAPQRVVGGDDDPRLGVPQPLSDGGGGEAREERHLHGADVGAGVRGDRDLGTHRKVDRHAVARLDPQPHETLGEPGHVPRELGEGELPPRAVLAGEDRADPLRLALGPAVDAVPGDGDRRAREPRRPLGPARVVVDLLPPAGELDAQVLDRRGPEPLGLLLRATDELPVALDAVPAHEPDDVRARERLLVRRPHDLGHGWRSLGGVGGTSLVAGRHRRRFVEHSWFGLTMSERSPIMSERSLMVDAIETKPTLRRRIIEAADALIREHGLAGATTREIARAAGCAEGSIYVHFEDKIDLVIAVIVEREPYFAELLELPGKAGERDGRGQPRAVGAKSSCSFCARTSRSSIALMGDRNVFARFKERLRERQTGPVAVFQAALGLRAGRAGARAASIRGCSPRSLRRSSSARAATRLSRGRWPTSSRSRRASLTSSSTPSSSASRPLRSYRPQPRPSRRNRRESTHLRRREPQVVDPGRALRSRSS